MTINRGPRSNPYEFIIMSALRAHQLMAGCTPRLDGVHKPTTMAQMEVVAGKVIRLPTEVVSSRDGR